MNPREQGDLGELSAMAWLASQGAKLDDRLLRVQVKTCTSRVRQRWQVALRTCGGNQSWNRVSKLLDPSRCDYLFVLVADGRQWFIPSDALGGGSGIRLGGPKYARFEVEQGVSISGPDAHRCRL
jgi:hypothetical protein